MSRTVKSPGMFHDYHHPLQGMQSNCSFRSSNPHYEAHRIPPVAHCRKVSSRGHGEEPVYKGIRYRPELGRYISEIRPALPRKRKIWLGTYKTAREAALAFDAGVYYTGKKISYNFPEIVKRLPPLEDNLDQDELHIAIQKRAKQAAAELRHSDDVVSSMTRSVPSSGSAGCSCSSWNQHTDNLCRKQEFYDFLPVSREASLVQCPGNWLSNIQSAT